MDMEVTFPGKKKINAAYKGFVIETDQSVEGGGDGSAPEPFALFLASLGTCAGIYVLSFCEAREIDPTGLKLELDFHRNETTNMVEKVAMRIVLPPAFPEKYEKAVIRVARQCTVTKHLDKPPEFEFSTIIGE